MTNSENTKLKFLDNHRPILKAGTYTYSVSQNIEIDGKPVELDKDQNTKFAAKQNFCVSAERFSLTDAEIYSVYPPAFSQGDHSNVLPHCLLQRSTLPWERLSDRSDPEIPWLGLLVFHGAEAPEIKTVTFKELMKSGDHTLFKSDDRDALQDDNESITVIDVPAKLLNRILPDGSALKTLAHVRQAEDEGNSGIGPERAALIANRLPLVNGTTTVHLISFEFRLEKAAFNFEDATGQIPIRLVTLKNWSFECTSHGGNFADLVNGLSISNGTCAGLGLPVQATDNKEIKARKQAGHVLLPHELHDGTTTAAWYHGPLAQAENTTMAMKHLKPVDSADELYGFDPTTKLLDVSYGAAWQLGRMKALRDKHFSLKLFNWKNSSIKATSTDEANSHFKKERSEDLFEGLFPERHEQSERTQDFSEIYDWLHDLALLEGVPFNYLVPDERMLPTEALRLFTLDWQWIEAMLDGAYSVGRVLKSDKDKDFERKKSKKLPTPHHRIISGVLIRSDLVSQWPGMHVKAFAKDLKDTIADSDKPSTKLRTARLASDTLMVLFDGSIGCIDLFLQPETLHFGFKDNHKEKGERADSTEIHTELRSLETGKMLGESQKGEPKWRGDPKDRVLEMEGFRKSIAEQLKIEVSKFGSADLAVQMIDGADRVRIHIG